MENFQQTTCLPLLRSSYNGLTKSEQKVVYAKPHLVLDPDLPAEEVVSAVMGLY